MLPEPDDERVYPPQIFGALEDLRIGILAHPWPIRRHSVRIVGSVWDANNTACIVNPWFLIKLIHEPAENPHKLNLTKHLYLRLDHFLKCCKYDVVKIVSAQ